MSAQYTTQDLIRKVKIPYDGEGIPPGWTLSTVDGKTIYTHTDGTIKDELPDTVSATSVESVMLSMISLDQENFNLWVTTLYLSAADVDPIGDTEAERAAYTKALNDLIDRIIIDASIRRLKQNRISEIPATLPIDESKGATSPEQKISKAYRSNLFDGHTLIGPISLDSGIGISEVEIIENYDVMVSRSPRSITDPVTKGCKNDIVMSITLEYPFSRLVDKKNLEGEVTQYGLRTLLATLKMAPICEISSSAILPVFVNNLLSPDSFQQLKKQSLEDALSTESTVFKNSIRNARKQLSNARPDINERSLARLPKNAPQLSAMEGGANGFEVLSVHDGDTFTLTGTLPSTGLADVRLIGYNSPEVDNEVANTVAQPHGYEMRDLLASLIPPGSRVWLEFDINKTSFSRSLAYVYTKEAGKLYQVNLRMMQKSPYNVPLSIQPNTKYREEFERASEAALYPQLYNFNQMLSTQSPLLDSLLSAEIDDKNEAEDRSDILAKLKEAPRDSKSNITVPAAYRGCLIKTAPNKTNSLLVKLFFSRFNDKAWQPGKILYCDRNGDLTTNVLDCPWIVRLANMVLMGKNSLNETMEEYAKPEDAGISFQWEDPLTRARLEFSPDAKTFIVQDVEAKSFMKVVTLPLIGEVYPVFQYMGITNLTAKFSMTVTSSLELSKFHEMKAELDKINYQAGPAAERRACVRIKNNILSMLGCKDFVISGITTHRSSQEENWVVEMEVIESRINYSDLEAIYVKSEDQDTIEDIRKIWDYMYDLLSEKVMLPGSLPFNVVLADNSPRVVGGKSTDEEFFNELVRVSRTPDLVYNYKVPSFEGNKGRSFLDDDGALAYRLVFGTDKRGDSSILDPNAMAATWYYLTQVKKLNTTNVQNWNTSYQNDPVVAAIMEGRLLHDSNWENASHIFDNSRDGDIDANGTLRTGGRTAYSNGKYYGQDFVITPDSPYSPLKLFDQANSLNKDKLDTRANLASATYRWLNKARVEYEEGEDLLSRTGQAFLSQEAETNIKQQGKELLDYLAGRTKAGTGRTNFFFTRDFWNAYFDILFTKNARADLAQQPAWSKSNLDVARSSLVSVLKTGLFLNFKGLKTSSFKTLTVKPTYHKVSIDQNDLSINDPNSFFVPPSNYGDMKMPTYGTMFSASEGGKSKLMVDKDGNELWKKFSPTWSDLGKKPPFLKTLAFQNIEEVINTIARDVDDPVEPGFFYYHTKVKPEAFTKALELKDKLAAKVDDVIQNHSIIVPTTIVNRGGSAISNYLNQIYSEPNRVSEPEAYNKESDRQALRKLVEGSRKKDKRKRNIIAIDENGQLLGTVRSGGTSPRPIEFDRQKGTRYQIFSGDGRDAIDPSSQSSLSKTHTDLILRTPDSTFRMNKMYPAYRLYFIERDTDKTYLVDDLYGINSVIEMSIRIDKEDAALLTAKISNVTDNLGFEEVLSNEARVAVGLAPDDAGEAFSSRLKIQSGTLIMVKMGYGSMESDLETIFTGMITEITPGQIIEIVAQGHKRELLNEVQFSMESMNHFDIIRKVLEKSETPNIGRKFSSKTLSIKALAELFPTGVNPRDYFGYMDRILGTDVTDMSNVHIASNAPLEASRRIYIDYRDGSDINSAGTAHVWEPLGKFFTSILPDSMMIDVFYANGKWAKWVVPPQPAWEAIQEVVRHRPGHIVDVVPYETSSTLFVGHPDQSYRAFKPRDFETRTFAILEPYLSAAQRISMHEEILGPFLGSDWVNVYRAYLKVYRTSQFQEGFDSTEPLFMHTDDPILSGKDPDYLTTLEAIIPRGETVRDLIRTKKTNDIFRTVLAKHIGIDSLPPGFDIMDDWWVYTSDLTKAYDYIGGIDKDLQRDLFYWFYDIEPILGNNAIVDFTDLRSIFLSPSNKLFTYYVNDLNTNPNNAFSVDYLSIKRKDTVYSDLTSPNRQISTLVSSGLLTQEEADVIGKRVQEASLGTYYPRSILDSYSYEGLLKTDLIGKENESLRQILVDTGGRFRMFIFYLYKWLQSNSKNTAAAKKANANKVANASQRMRISDLPPGERVFRSYYILGPKDIIDNNIVASMSEMANCVLVRAPTNEVEYKNSSGTDAAGNPSQDIIVEYEETAWGSYPTTDGVPFSPRIGRENRKLAVVQELNAISKDQKMKTLLTNMGLVLQPMYRGSIVTIGQAIKPYDVVYVHDTFKDLRGHFEVASVTHHFSGSTGWITEIEPHALVRVNNPTSEFQILTMQTFLRDISGIVDYLNTGILVIQAAAFVASIFTGNLQLLPVIQAAGTAAASATSVASRSLIVRALSAFGRKVVGSSLTSAFASTLGRLASPLGLYGLVAANAGLGVADIYTSISVKHQLNSLTLPIDLHLLLYRGQRFHAGLDVQDEDVYSLYDKLIGSGSDLRKSVDDTVSSVLDTLASVVGEATPPGNAADQVNIELGNK